MGSSLDENGTPRLRQQVGGTKYIAYDSWCGAPRITSGGVSKETAMFESQAAYLKRNSLLHPGELERLKPTDFLPIGFAIYLAE